MTFVSIQRKHLWWFIRLVIYRGNLLSSLLIAIHLA
jgi:hypothetical protein